MIRFVTKFSAVLCVVAVVAMQDSAEAQITLQQPIISRFAINTSVSVPDRGRIHLGGVKRAFSSRNSPGFFQPGSGIGLERSYSGMSAGVRIMDLREMDRQILGYDPYATAAPRAVGRSTRYLPALTERSQASYKQYTQQLTESRKPRLASATFKLAKKAEEQGKIDRARKLYEKAKGYGSAEAVVKLAELNGKTSSVRNSVAQQSARRTPKR